MTTYTMRQKRKATNYEDSGLVFASSKDTPLYTQNIVKPHFKPLLSRADLPLSVGTIYATHVPPCYSVAACLQSWYSTF